MTTIVIMIAFLTNDSSGMVIPSLPSHSTK